MSEFVCQRCGACCGLVPFTRADYKAVQREARNMDVSFRKQEMLGKTTYFVRRLMEKFCSLPPDQAAQADYTCPFVEYDGSGKASCKIYDKRPLMCRLFGAGAEGQPLLRCPRQKES
jgi:Fe-S-cluster containining protein